jgi:pimeloyl-ACP methyl ester carboxylesterase
MLASMTTHRSPAALLRCLALAVALGPPAAGAAGLTYRAVTAPDGIVINVAEAGPRDAPAVLLLHGIGQSHASWRLQMEGALVTRLRLVAPDLRAHGDSGKPADRDAYRQACRWADDVRAVEQALGLERPVLVGWSFGGLVAMHYVRCHGTDSLAGLALVSTAAGRLVPPASGGSPQAASAAADMSQPDLRANLRGARSFAKLMTARAPDAEWEAETVAALLRLPAYARRAMAGEQSGPDGKPLTTNEDLASRLTLPLLAVVGGRDALMDGGALSRTYRERFPQASVLVYADAGHSPFAEEPERFARDLEEFVRSARARRPAPRP